MPADAAFNFFASLEDQGQQEIRHVRVEQELQKELSDLMSHQRDDLIDADEVPFDGRYQPTEDEVFFIDGFALPADIVRSIEKPTSAPPLDRQTADRWDALKSFFAGRVASGGRIEAVFQVFDRRRSLAHSKSIIIRNETFSRLDEPGIILDNRAVAVVRNDRLYFRSYISARRVLDLSQFYRIATDDDVKKFTQVTQLAFEDTAQFVAGSDAQIRRKIALINDSAILQNVTPAAIQKAASAYGLTIAVRSGRLVIPRDKKDVKAVLRFLEENYFTSELTGTRFLTSSKRPVPK